MGLWYILSLTEVPLGHRVVPRYIDVLYKQITRCGSRGDVEGCL